MFTNDMTIPTTEGIASLVERRLCSPDDAEAMLAAAAVARRLPSGEYRVAGVVAGGSSPWVRVAAKWNGEPIDGDVSAELVAAMAPLEVRCPSFSADTGMFWWSVEAPAAPAESAAAGEDDETA